MNDQSSSPPPRDAGADTSSAARDIQDAPQDSKSPSAWQRFFRRFRNGGNGSVRETLEEIIEERADDAAPIGDDERLLLTNILNLRGRTVGDVMVPRADIVAVEVETPLKDIVAIIAEQGHTRLPVYRGTLDDAIGMAHIKDLFLWEGREQDFKLAEHLRRILFVAPSMEVLELLLEMRARRSHMALVVDEYGSLQGIVTLEDIIEEIVGEIDDEHDLRVAGVEPQPDGTYLLDGTVTIRDLNREYEWGLPDEEAATVAGLILHEARRIPDVGQSFRLFGFRFDIVTRHRHQITRVRVTPPQPGEIGD